MNGRVGTTGRLPATLREVEVPPRRLAEYAGIAEASLLEDLAAAGRRLAGMRVLHVNATAFGGGVAELLASEIALMRDAGVDAHWSVLCPDARLFEITKRMHNGMQGRRVELPFQDIRTWLQRNEHCAPMLGRGWDAIVVHDPQPAALAALANDAADRWIWRCHIDTSAPDPAVWPVVRPYVQEYDAAVFTLPEFRPRDLGPQPAAFIAPAIDPLSTKNRPLPRHVRREAVAAAGIDLSRPLVLQVSRFDPWKDQLGVLDAWRIAREEIPGLQLALVGSMADDDPEAWEVYDAVRTAAAGDPDCHVLTNHGGIGPLEVNALQSEADVVVQKSLREGFGLTVAEALWKETPVVGGRAGGIPAQIGDDEGGILVEDVASCAAAIVTLLREPELAARRARAGRERVRDQFLTPRLALDDLMLLDRDSDRRGVRTSPLARHVVRAEAGTPTTAYRRLQRRPSARGVDMTLATALPLADTWGMHGDVGTGWWVVMVAAMAVFWGVVILIGARLLRDGFQRHPSAPADETPTAVLERRLAEGAITVEEYEQRRRALAQPASAEAPAAERPLAGAAAPDGASDNGDDGEGR